jgi:putative transposase
VHLIRYSLSFCGWKERKLVAEELKEIYKSPTAKMAEKRLEEFDQSQLGKKYPMISQSWRRNWEEVIPFFHYPQEIRTMIYTTNTLENVNMRIRKITKKPRPFPSDEAAIKLIYSAL